METKTLAFDVRDIERFKEFFPDFKSGKMSGRELGSKLLEVLDNQSASAAISFQSEEDAFKALQVQFQELQEHCKQLEEGRLKEIEERKTIADTKPIILICQDTQDNIYLCDALIRGIEIVGITRKITLDMLANQIITHLTDL